MPTDPMKRGGNGSKRKAQTSYFVDRKFVPRIKEFLENSHGQPDVEDVVDYLRESFVEYGRRKRNVLKLSALKALNNINASNDGKSKQFEERYLSKRLKRSRSLDNNDNNDTSEEFNSDSDFSLNEGEELMEYVDSNVANNSMQNLYKITSKPSSATPTSSSGNNLADNKTLAWEIDRRPSLATEIPSKKLAYVPINSPLQEMSSISKTNQSKPQTFAKVSQDDLSTVESSIQSSKEDVKSNQTPVNSVKTSLSAISEDERSIPSRPGTPLGKSISKSTRKKSESSKLKKFEPSVSKVTFKDVGGCASCLQEVSKLLLHLKHPEIFTQLGIKPPRGFLLHGAPGCGKTLLANAIAGELQIPFFKIAAPEVVSGISGESEQKIRSLFTEAMMMAPSILFIDEIDSITPKRENAGKEMERRVVTQILTCMDELASADSHVLVIGATNRPDSLDPALRRAGRFDREIAMGIPDKNARKGILQVICRDLRLSEDFDYDRIASKTPGFVGADIQALAREAAMCAVDNAFKQYEEQNKVVVQLFTDSDTVKSTGQDSSLKESNATSWLRDQPPLTEDQLSKLYISTEHFESALPNVQPSAKREGFATVPDVSWEDIGALEDIRDELTMAIMAPVQNPEEFESLGLTTPPGILLAGPPGCGKTLLAKAIANEAGINFISVKGPELLNMYVGESEKAVRQVFQRARNSSPCVIFFDEIDALCPRRSQMGDSTASSRVVNQLLTEMDGLEARKQVFIMAATNRPDILDGAILRPGRLDKLLYVGLPDATDRTKILNTITKNGTKPLLGNDVNIETLSTDARCEGLSGADLNALIREASVAALKECMKHRTNQVEAKSNVTNQITNQTRAENQAADNSDVKALPISTEKLIANGTKIDAGDESDNVANVDDAPVANVDDAPGEKISSDSNADTVSIVKTPKTYIMVYKKHFEMAFEKVKPSVSGKDRLWYDDMKKRNIRS